MTSLLAVSVFVLQSKSLASVSPNDTQAIFNDVSPSIAVVVDRGSAIGTAVLIDSDGLFLVHRSSIGEQDVTLRLSNGKEYVGHRVATDEPTQLSLIEANGFQETSIRPMTVSLFEKLEGRPVVGVVGSGPFSGVVSAADLPGIVRPSLRYLPLTELRFESNGKPVGGALVFGNDRRLIGILGATLEPVADQDAANRQSVILTERSQLVQNDPKMGPAAMTVGYSVGPAVLRRVVEGFKSMNHDVLHPSIGLFFKNTANAEGAMVEAVLTGSSSDQAGIKKGDIVTKAGDLDIHTGYDLAAYLFRQTVGAKVKLTLKRASGTSDEVTVDVLGVNLGSDNFEVF